MHRLLLLISLTLFPLFPSWAEVFRPIGHDIRLKISFTLGTHVGKTDDLQGKIDIRGNQVHSFLLTVPISKIDLGKPEINCHLQEALGLDYKDSDYPDEHVCNSQHQLLGVKYKEIRFESKKSQPIGQTLHGFWTIHGVRHEATIPLEIRRQEGQWTASGKTSIWLPRHGIQVKPYYFIETGKEAFIEFKIVFGPSPK